ncbi:MAG: polyphosphate kinase 1 [Candidatus Kapaibacterium sp.]
MSKRISKGKRIDVSHSSADDGYEFVTPPLAPSSRDLAVHRHRSSVKRFINREISWLAFNGRVLEEAQDRTTPLLERLRFLGIFSNNLDEFYRVRIATVRRLMKIGSKAKTSLHAKPADLLAEVQEIVLGLNRTFESTYESIRKELRRHGVNIIDETMITPQQSRFVKDYFADVVRPALVPVMLNQVQTFPYLRDSAIYLAIRLSSKKSPKHPQFSLVEVPTALTGRFVKIPSTGRTQTIILLEDIIRHNLAEIFAKFEFDSIEAYTVKLTRDQELDLDSDISASLLDKIARSVKNRQKGAPVRFVYDAAIAPDLLDLFRAKMKLQGAESMIPAGRYHNFKDFIGFPTLGLTHLRYEPLKQLSHPDFLRHRSAFDAIKERDIMVHYPYQTFGHLLDLLREAAIDPEVRRISMTLYRAAKASHVVNALVNAARNGKAVTVVVELQARFDEEANIQWARELADAGINVIYGVPSLKVHAKLVLVERNEGKKRQAYAHVSTGNFNEVTARTYCDDGLFTADKRITSEVQMLFAFFEKNYLLKNTKHLIVSPMRTRSRLLKLIDAEIAAAKEGRPSGITLKVNSLVDEQMIEALYKASGAGVRVDLIVRGMCALIPGVPGMSENIRVVSIIDRFLEHSRIFRFEHGGEPLFFLSSADMMTRNLDQRIEVTCPVYDSGLQQELQDILDLQSSDTVKARRWNWPLPRGMASRKIRSQFLMIEHLALLSRNAAATKGRTASTRRPR